MLHPLRPTNSQTVFGACPKPQQAACLPELTRYSMKRFLVPALLLTVVPLAARAAPADKKAYKEALKKGEEVLGKKNDTTVDKGLAGDLTRKKEETAGGTPLEYDQFRLQ